MTAIYVLICGKKEKCGVMENMKVENAVIGVICAVRIMVDNKYTVIPRLTSDPANEYFG